MNTIDKYRGPVVKIFTSNRVTNELLEEIRHMMPKTGYLEVSFDVTGRTRHFQLANELKDQLPEFQFFISMSNYDCKISKL